MQKKLSSRKEYPEILQNVVWITISSIIAIIVTFILSFFFSLILNKSVTLPENPNFYLTGIALIGALINGVISTFKCKLKGVVSGVVTSIPFALFITIVLLSFSKGHIESKTGILYLLIFIVSAIGGILGANIKRRK